MSDGAGDMRGDEHVGRAPQRMVGRKRLRLGDVERRADAAGPKGVEQSIGVDGPAASCIHEQGTGGHLGKELRIDELLRLGCER